MRSGTAARTVGQVHQIVFSEAFETQRADVERRLFAQNLRCNAFADGRCQFEPVPGKPGGQIKPLDIGDPAEDGMPVRRYVIGAG